MGVVTYIILFFLRTKQLRAHQPPGGFNPQSLRTALSEKAVTELPNT